MHSNNQQEIKIKITYAVFNCRVFGNGKTNVIAFHGFGQNGDAFKLFARQHPSYTIYAIDLPFHGDTVVHDPSSCLSTEEITALIQKLIGQTGIQRFSLLAFSIGCKIVFPILEMLPTKVKHVWLLAPDGIILSRWYLAATGTIFMRYIFRFMLTNFKLFKGLARLLRFLNLIDRNTELFAIKSLNTKEKRTRLYHTWIGFRKLKMNVEHLSVLLNTTTINLHFVMGKYDNIIPKSKIEPFLRGLSTAQLVVLPCGHQKLIEFFSDWKLKYIN